MDDYASYWDLSERYNLNHGAFGSTPIAVLEYQKQVLAEMNRDRKGFFKQYFNGRLIDVEAKLAAFVGVSSDDLVLVDNATDGFNAVLKSLEFQTGDEILITNQIYVNFLPVLQDISRRCGVRIVQADVPVFPRQDDEIIEPLLSGVSERTRLVIVDHITSPSAFIMPVEKIVRIFHGRGIDVLVDGAHAPGQIPLNIEEIGAAYYIFTNHKWICAPLSSGGLYVRRDRQEQIMPAAGSGWASVNCPFKERFEWTGTRDVSARICVAETLAYMEALHQDGWGGIMRRNHEMAVRVRNMLADALGLCGLVPDSMMGSMFCLPVDSLVLREQNSDGPVHQRLESGLLEQYGIYVAAPMVGKNGLLRISCHLYNKESDYSALLSALEALTIE